MAFPVENPLADEEIIYRSVPRKGNPAFWNESQNRPSTAAFWDKHNRVSVNWHRYMPDPTDSARRNAQAVVSLLVGDCRASRKEVDHTPIQAEEPFGPNQAHAEICDPAGTPLDDEERAIARDELSRRAVRVWQAPET